MTWKEMERRKRWVSINKWWTVERVLFVCRVIYRHCPLNTRTHTHTHMLTSRGRERRRQRERERLFAFTEALCLSAHICLKASWRAGKRLNWRRCEWARVNERQRECMYVRERESEGERERGRGALHPCSLLKTEPVVLHSEVPQAEEERAGNIKLCFACALSLFSHSICLTLSYLLPPFASRWSLRSVGSSSVLRTGKRWRTGSARSSPSSPESITR